MRVRNGKHILGRTDMVPQILLNSSDFLSLAVKLLVQQPYLRLRLLSSSLRLRRLISLLRIPFLFFCAEVFEIVTKGFCIFPDTFEIRFQQSNIASDIALLRGDIFLFLFSSLQFVSLIR
jgi:hypothetical protein